MLTRNEVFNIVTNKIKLILNDIDDSSERNVFDSTSFVKDLEFKSLMMAQLIMLVQDDILVEPFSEIYSISDISTIGEFVDVYYQTIVNDKTIEVIHE
ncbi:hypothetical protein A3712_00295 [Vibrio sp. HI00D65]|uniref:hypothetical protein n=1 Tax=Vibrio sp. HI00D65 TaxID=1822216 RepID=UPI0007B8C455|nr:hypothetical protein [Vibrio sp. HI00D65]KZX70649.1 hypothetical protein A3712_00295 [Vibrio sp. HI00D65]